MATTDRIKATIIRRMKAGVKYTKCGQYYYSTFNSLYGDRLNINQQRAIKQMVKDKIAEFKGNTLTLIENENK